MIIRDRSYPHPILSSFRDDVEPNRFELLVSVLPDADNYYIDVTFKYKNETIEQMTDDGRASHAVHIECRKNYFRRIFSFKESTRRITIPSTQLVGRVEISGFVKVERAVCSYVISGSHDDYGTQKFDLKPGDLLAVAESHQFDAYVDYDPLKNIASILDIRRSDELDEGPMKIDMTDDKYVIAILSKRDFDRYTALKGDPKLGPLLANQVAVPAILEAISEIRKTSDDDLENEMSKKWFRSIVKKLKDSGIEIRSSDISSFGAVQTLLKLPLRRSLEGIGRINPIEDSSDETSVL